MPLITSKREARERESELKRQIKAGTFLNDSPLKNFTKFYKEIFMDYSRENKSELAVKFDEYYGTILIAEFGRFDLGQLTPRIIEKFLLKLSKTKTKYGKTFSPVTVRMIYDRLNQVFNQAVRERVFTDNPCRLVNRSVLKDFPSWQPRERWLNKYASDEEERLFKELDGQIATICRLILNTGLRPPHEILMAEKSHINLSEKAAHYRFTQRDGKHLESKHALIPPHAILVVQGKDKTTRFVPLNKPARRILEVLCADKATGDYLFVNREGKPMGSFKKGFAAACVRAEIENLRPYDFRHTFATRLEERYVHQYTISALLGHARPVSGFGHESRITPGYAHATWEAMQRAVESLEYSPTEIVVFGSQSGKSQAKRGESDTTEEKVKAG